MTITQRGEDGVVGKMGKKEDPRREGAVKVMVTCPDCAGSGEVYGGKTCGRCKGAGEVEGWR